MFVYTDRMEVHPEEELGIPRYAGIQTVSVPQN